MKKTIAVLVLLLTTLCVATDAYGARIAKNDVVVLKLYETACSDTVSVFIPPKIRALFRAGELIFTAGEALERFGAGPHPVCWMQVEDQVLVVGDDGSVDAVDESVFMNEPSALLNPPTRYPERPVALNQF